MDSRAYGQTSQQNYANGFTFQPDEAQQQHFAFSPATQQALALGPAPLDPFGQHGFGGGLSTEPFVWPAGFDAFQFEQATNGEHALPPIPQPPFQPAPLQPAPVAAQRFHPYGNSRTPASGPSPSSLATPPARPSPAHSTPRPPVTYPEAGTPLTVLPSPAPTITEKQSPPPPRPRPSARLRRINSSPSLVSPREDTPTKLDSLFSFLDAHDWTVSEMLVALSKVPTDEEGSDLRTKEHVKRMDEFYERGGRISITSDAPAGPEEIANLWKGRQGAGDGSERALVSRRGNVEDAGLR